MREFGVFVSMRHASIYLLCPCMTGLLLHHSRKNNALCIYILMRHANAVVEYVSFCNMTANISILHLPAWQTMPLTCVYLIWHGKHRIGDSTLVTTYQGRMTVYSTSRQAGSYTARQLRGRNDTA
jgi:hypothetical protein